MRVFKWVAPVVVILLALVGGVSIFWGMNTQTAETVDPELLAGPAPAPTPVVPAEPETPDGEAIVGTLEPAAAPLPATPARASEEQVLVDRDRHSVPTTATPLPDERWVRLTDTQYVAVFRVRHRDVEELLQLLELVPGELRADKATGALIATGSADALRAIEYLLSELDMEPHEQAVADTTDEEHKPRASALAVVPAPTVEISAPETETSETDLEEGTVHAAAETATQAVPAVAREADRAGHPAGTRVLLRTYRIAAGFLNKPELANLASANPCVAAIRKWLGSTGAATFSTREIDGCVEALTGLGLLASVHAQDVLVPDSEEDVRLKVAPDGTIHRTDDGEAEGIVVRVDAETVTLIIGKEQQLSIGRPDSSYLAYVGSETDRSDENATGLLVVLTPAPVTAADVKTDEKVTPSSYRK